MGTVESEEMSLNELITKVSNWLLFLKNKWITILFCGVIGATIGFLYSKSKKPLFIAESTFVLEDGGEAQGGLGAYSSIASMVGIDLNSSGGGAFKGDNILELYKSRKMIQETLLSQDEFNGKTEILIDRYIAYNRLREKWSKNIVLKNLNFATKRDEYRLEHDSILGTIVNEIRSNYLQVSRPDKKLSIIKVEFKYPDELFARAFTLKIVETVNEFYVRTKTKKAIENLAILQHQADSIKRALNLGISNVASEIDANPNINLAFQSLKVPSQKKQIDVQANGAIYQEIVKNLELSKISLRKEKPLIQLIDSPILPLEKTSFSAIKGLVLGSLVGILLSVFVITIVRVFKKVTSC